MTTWAHVTTFRSFKDHKYVLEENVSEYFGDMPLKMLLTI